MVLGKCLQTYTFIWYGVIMISRFYFEDDLFFKLREFSFIEQPLAIIQRNSPLCSVIIMQYPKHKFCSVKTMLIYMQDIGNIIKNQQT